MNAEREIRNAIVTGPTGAIGVALCELLGKKGITVYAAVRPDSPRRRALPEGVKAVECDLSELSHLPELVSSSCDAFFHLGWVCTAGAGRNDMDAQIRNIQYTIDACRAARVLGCSVFVGAGSQAEYGRVDHALTPDTPCFPENGYGMAKLCSGQMSRIECRKLGIVHIWPRILSVYGPYDGKNAMIPKVIRTLLAGERPALTPGEQLWDYLCSKDAARALYALACTGRDGGVYPLASGEARPLREYIEELRDTVDPALPLGLGELPYGPQQVMHLAADISSLNRDTGFRPEISFSAGIRDTIEWVRRNHE